MGIGRRSRMVGWVGVVVLGAALAPAFVAALPGDELPLVYEDVTGADRAWGIRIDSPGGDLAVHVLSAGLRAPRLTVGWVDTDAAGHGGFMVSLNLINSPDRLIIDTGRSTDAPRPDLRIASAETDTTCQLYCIVGTFSDAGPATHYMVVWIAGATTGTVAVRGPAGTTVAVNTGSAYARGDEDTTGGAPNVQAQQGQSGYALGAKLIQDATLPLTVAHRFYGVWYAFDAKLVCYLAGCFVKAQLDYPLQQLCTFGSPVCGNAQISYAGPGGLHSNAIFNVFKGTATGDYAFNIDLMADAYLTRGAPLVPVQLSEYFTVLSAADVGVPS